jgi:CubicO group peptidase (beta-lactamase class C family)
MVNDETKLLSNSMGKSLVSYVTGHAICEGYIEDINVKLDDWPLIQGTLYANLMLVDILDMRARDEKYVDDMSGMKSTGRWYNIHSIKSFAKRELKDSKPSSKWSNKYRYNGFATNIIMNYTIHKSGADFQKLLNKIFQEKAGIEHSAFFLKNKWQRFDNGRLNKSLPKLTDADGRAWYQFYASRYDYLRIAKAILNDWKNDTCVGKYLKKIFKGRKPKNIKTNHARLKHTRGYGGQFHTDAAGMASRNIMAMEGYGGQAIMIDFDKSRIVVLNTVHTNFDWHELVLQPIKNGDIKN